MKSIITLFLIFSIVTTNAQTRLTPGTRSFQKKWIKSETYVMTWYALKDTLKMEIGEVSTEVLKEKGLFTIVTSVAMKNSKAPWIDTTVANLSTLSPIRHTSSNMQRDMVLNFGKIVTGYYSDKTKQVQTLVSDTTRAAYFDSNLYPALITLLPLKEGYIQDISIYDYNPTGKIGVIGAFIKNVTSGTFQSNKSGNREVWIVTVRDEISGDLSQTSMTYYIDKSDRKLWKQEISAGARKMLLQRKEN